MSSKTYMMNSTTRNAVHLQRLAFGEFKKAVKYLDELQVSINGTLATGDWTQARQRQVTIQIAQLNKEYLDAMTAQIAESAQDAGKYTAGYTKRLMDKAANIKFAMPDGVDLDAKILTAVMEMSQDVKPITIQQSIKKYGDNKAAEINRVLSDGIITSATKDEIIAGINSTVNIARGQAEALVRTTINSSANVGRAATLLENKQYLEGYEWVSKLDDRTTEICTDRDGKVYPFASGSPMPPAHWNCRSQIVAAILPKYQQRGIGGTLPKREKELKAKMLQEFADGKR